MGSFLHFLVFLVLYNLNMIEFKWILSDNFIVFFILIGPEQVFRVFLGTSYRLEIDFQQAVNQNLTAPPSIVEFKLYYIPTS